MTREEAIAYWKQRSEHIHNWLEENEDVDFIGEYVEAIDMAIEALRREEAEEKGYCHRIIPSNVEVVVRCKDCKHYEFADNRAFGMPVKYCDWFGFVDVDDNDFCSRGERQET